MKHFVATILLVFLCISTSMGQRHSIEGGWVMMNKGNGPMLSKIFLPDGRLMGLRLGTANDNLWLMGDYVVRDDSTYQEHLFFHFSIDYQRDITFSFRMENDSLMTTTYTNILPNGMKVPVTEQWTRIPTELLDNLKAAITTECEEWLLGALANSGRLPKEGQTIEQKGQELAADIQRYMDNRQLDRAYEALLVRAELDTTNAGWQTAVMDFYMNLKVAPSMAEKISNRIVRLAEKRAISPTDTAVVNAYKMQTILYGFRGNGGKEETRRSATKAIELEEMSGRQPTKDLGVLYFMKAVTFMPEKDFPNVYENAIKAASVFETVTDVDNTQKGNGYFLIAVALYGQNRHKECIDRMRHAMPFFADSLGQSQPKLTNEIYPVIFNCYGALFLNNLKDKKLAAEYKEFMADKMLCVDFVDANNPWGVKGRYYMLERDDWNMESPYACNSTTDAHHYLLQQDGTHVSIDLSEGQSLNGEARVVTVGKKWKQQVLKSWKKFKKRGKNTPW